MTVHGTLHVDVVEKERDPETGKVFLRLMAHDGTQLDITLNLAVMIGGIAAGAAQRFGYDEGPKQ
jgi:hypothetical protein